MNQRGFKLSAIGDTSPRTTLGPLTSVEIFRIMRTSLADIIVSSLGEETANAAIYNTGKAVGGEIGRAFLADAKDLNDFIQKVRELLIKLKIGVLSVVSADLEKGQVVIRVDECTTCSGVPNTGKCICYFEGGVIAGALKFFIKKEVKATETKCWGTGDNFCEFFVEIEK